VIEPPWDPAKKVAAAAYAAAQHRFLTHVKPRITPAVIAEHRADPFGRHSVDLDIVLRYLGRDLMASRPRYVLVAEVPYGRCCIGENPRIPGAPIKVTHECYASEEEAQHAIFLRRLHDLGDPEVSRVLGAGA
jgi:hypothetical protein